LENGVNGHSVDDHEEEGDEGSDDGSGDGGDERRVDLAAEAAVVHTQAVGEGTPAQGDDQHA